MFTYLVVFTSLNIMDQFMRSLAETLHNSQMIMQINSTFNDVVYSRTADLISRIEDNAITIKEKDYIFSTAILTGALLYHLIISKWSRNILDVTLLTLFYFFILLFPNTKVVFSLILAIIDCMRMSMFSIFFCLLLLN